MGHALPKHDDCHHCDTIETPAGTMPCSTCPCCGKDRSLEDSFNRVAAGLAEAEKIKAEAMDFPG